MEEKSNNNTYTDPEEENLSTGITPEINANTNISETFLSPESEQLEEDPQQNETKKEKFKRLAVKALIWLGFFTAHAILTTCLNFAGITLGAIPATVIFGLTLLFAKECGKTWDKRCYNKKLKRKKSTFNDTSVQLNESDANVSEICLSTEGEEPTTNGKFYGKDMLLEENTENPINDYSLSKQDENIDYNKSLQSLRYRPAEDVATDQESQSSSDLSYREEKKAIRRDYQKKKKALKNEHGPTSNKNGFKYATVILSILLIVSIIINTNQFIKSEDLVLENNSLTSKVNQLTKSLEESKNKETEYFKLYLQYSDKASFLTKRIALIDGDNPYYYHTYDCEDFQNADSYLAFNINTAENEGYIRHYCWDN